MDSRLFYCGVALVSAACWALGAILWRKLGERISSYTMNLAKTAIGTLCLLLLLPVIGVEPVGTRSLMLLGLSGIIGIAIGDTFFFLSLMQLGPRRASLMGSLNPVAIAVGAAIILGERPAIGAWGGIVATTCGVAWVIWERSSGGDQTEENRLLGIRYGLLSVLCTTAAVLLAKAGLVSVPTVQAAAIRLAAGCAGLAVWGLFRGELGGWLAPLRKPVLLGKVGAVVVVVVIGGFWLSLLALKHIDAAIAGTLNATSPLFMLPMAVLLLGERLSARAVIGTIIAVSGVGMILRG